MLPDTTAGGYKPVDVRVLVQPVLDTFRKLFFKTFSRKRNAEFMDQVQRSFTRGKWRVLLKAMQSAVANARARMQPSSSDTGSAASKEKQQEQVLLKPGLVSQWQQFESALEHLTVQVHQAENSFAFSFVEGLSVCLSHCAPCRSFSCQSFFFFRLLCVLTPLHLALLLLLLLLPPVPSLPFCCIPMIARRAWSTLAHRRAQGTQGQQRHRLSGVSPRALSCLAWHVSSQVLPQPPTLIRCHDLQACLQMLIDRGVTSRGQIIALASSAGLHMCECERVYVYMCE